MSADALTRRTVIAGGGAMAAAAVAPGVFAQAGAGAIRLRILETTDIHVHVHSYDYYRDQPDDTMGLARVAALVDKARSEARNTLLFENGDFLQGNPMGDIAASERGFKAGDTHPIIRAMNQMRFDAGTLGNHEFDYGLDFLAKSLAGSKYPVVCANVAKASSPARRGATTRS